MGHQVTGHAIGEQVSVRGYKLNVIGTIKKEGSSMVNVSPDDYMIIPVNYARNLVVPPRPQLSALPHAHIRGVCCSYYVAV